MAENYQVKQGDCVYSIAFEKGFFPETIWDHPNNKELKSKRNDPHLLMPDDVVHVPDLRPKEVTHPTNQVHKFRLKNTPKLLRIQLKYLEMPLKNIEYKLKLDNLEKEGKTDSEGWLSQSIPPNAKAARLILPDGLEFDLRLGHLDPIDEISGIQKRLQSLGFYTDSITGKLDDATRQSIMAFQLARGIEVTGEAEEQTKLLLEQLAGK